MSVISGHDRWRPRARNRVGPSTRVPEGRAPSKEVRLLERRVAPRAAGGSCETRAASRRAFHFVKRLGRPQIRQAARRSRHALQILSGSRPTSGARRPRSARSSRSKGRAYRAASPAVMALGGIAELVLGVRAEKTQLEDVAKPLTVEDTEGGGDRGEEGTGETTDDGGDTPDPLREERWRTRDERRRGRRYRPGPGAGEAFYSPGMVGSALHSRQVAQDVLDREVDARGVARLERAARPRWTCRSAGRSPLGARPIPSGACRGDVRGSRPATRALHLRSGRHERRLTDDEFMDL